MNEKLEPNQVRDLVAQAWALVSEASGDPDAPRTFGGEDGRRARLSLELACSQVETKLLKREQYRQATEMAEDELRDACHRLHHALARARKAVEPKKQGRKENA